MTNIWKSADKVIHKEIIEKGIFSKKPAEKSTCDVVIENLQIKGYPNEYTKEKLHSDFLDGVPQKRIIVGSANSRVDSEIERALQMMFIRERSLITIVLPPTDETDDKEVIVKFEMTLKNMKFYKYLWEWSPEEKYETALKLKEKGNKLFKGLRYVDAFFRFSKACKTLITMEPLENKDIDETLVKKINDLRIILYNNMAECHLHRDNYEHVIKLCTKVLDRDEKNIKALYRRGVAYGCERNFEKAVEDMKRIISIEPKNIAAREKYNIYSEQVKESHLRADEMIKRMFKT